MGSKLKYALPEVGGERWGDDLNNPMSPAFLPLTERDETGKARFWAMLGKRKTDPSVEYEPNGKKT